MTKKSKGPPFIKFELPKFLKKGTGKPSEKPEKPEKSKPTDRLTTLAVGEENGRSDQ
ncbi:MAG TPA: hypothetical protein VF794_36890 [Archangium sp.]|uniref:hypothetical protein n=1 Tax=Archangium sp. TaxID=1872627 RepID=UPI002ED818EF